jgi:hypothetical protein
MHTKHIRDVRVESSLTSACATVRLFSYLRQHTDKQGGQWIITGSESWPGYWVKTDSESITLKMAHLKGLKSAYVTYYKTDGSYSDGTHDYKFDAHELCVDEDSITDQVTKFYEIQIGRDRTVA